MNTSKLTAIEEYLQQEVPFEALESVALAEGRMPHPRYVRLCIAGGRKQKVCSWDILGA
ncbi:hypothetical protein [Halioglobus sp. HI00S01]|uniref:hypothetical protein n=1 Tax=Halioglobus sp. HI00S01 TaxID=1822214 RepID=UPI0012E90CEB|nr:hypothetical protein [Halioglobus sp. HI00S01]